MGNDFPATGSPPMIGKMLSIEEWKKYVAGYDFGSIPPSRVVLHHTWSPTVEQWKGLASMKGMQKFYAGKGWNAAPHIYVGPDGIWLFTPMREVGIHAGSGNSGNWGGKWSYSIGIEMVGNYDKVRPSGAVWEGSKAVMGELSKRLGIAPDALIYFHRDFSTKSCPGWAVTKEWVKGEVNAYVNNAKPPKPPAPGPIGTPTPEEELVMESLLNESFLARAEGYSSESAFDQYAVEHGLGMPLAKIAQINEGGKTYAFQPFARDTIFCEVPKWGDVKTLNDLLGGSIPPRGLGRALLDATYRACGATFHADWAFHQHAVVSKMGPPVGESKKITVGGKEYAYQAYAVDTLYNVVPKWSEINMLSRLSGANDAASVALREALLAATYQSGSATYHPDWAFHQLARTLDSGAGIGPPLSESKKITIGNATYSIQVYALDTLYNLVPNWSDVKRLRDLARAEGIPSFGVGAGAGMSFGVGATTEEIAGSWEPPEVSPFQITRYSPMSPSYSSRGGKPVSMVFIHGDAGLASATLERMTTIGARASTHYYITVDGMIYQLVDERNAAWHSGMATLGGLWFDTNGASIGITLERMPELLEWEPKPGEVGSDHVQLNALHWLLRDLVRRYRLTADDVILSSSLASSQETIPQSLLLTDMFR